MPTPSSGSLSKELNTAKQAQPENVGALTCAQLTPEAARKAQGHDVPGHDHTLHSYAPGEPDPDDHDEHDHGPAGANLYLLPGLSLALLLAGLALDSYKVGFFTGYVWKNIWLAFAVKAVVLALGAGGLATRWEAVFAGVGVARLAILNTVRIQRLDFTK